MPVRALRGGNGTLLFYGGAACFRSHTPGPPGLRPAKPGYARAPPVSRIYMTASVLIADDEALIRQSVKALLID
ncbi:MAG TPA: hypothetical protein VFG23_10480, partial [Polyangia bacterium]|nr:hypothetical protein [Polyangia bacterium]